MDAQLLIDGEWISARRRDCMPLIDPATEEPLGKVPIAAAGDLDRAMDAMDRDWQQWHDASPERRGAALARIAQLLSERRQQIAATLSREQGKTRPEALAEVDTSARLFAWYATESRRVYGRLVAGAARSLEMQVIQEPVGPVAVFTPWNFPLVEPAAHIAPALAAGCPLIAKVSEETPLTSGHLFRAILDADVPPGIVHLVTGDPAFISDRLIQSPIIRKIAFTGSLQAGRQLAAKAGHFMKPSTMELGGNAPAIVFDDAPAEATARLLATMKCRNAGQVCTAPNRLFVHEAVYGEFLHSYTEAMRGVRIGPASCSDSQMGPVANSRRLAAMTTLLEDAQGRGARVALGRGRLPGRGFFYDNTVLVDVPDDALVSTQEIFGPISPLLSFSELDDVIQRANATHAGLAAYVFTSDLDHARYIAHSLQAGTVAVNHGAALFPEAPFGGVKDSGFGRICGPEGIAEYLMPKVISTSFPNLHAGDHREITIRSRTGKSDQSDHP
jgi:succinate-semialdehyde dehydrogenase / glutarate-semialdehyde dehydrogenase